MVLKSVRSTFANEKMMLKYIILSAHMLISGIFVLGAIGANCTHSMKMRTVRDAIATADVAFDNIMLILIVVLPLTILLATYLFGESNRGTRIAIIGSFALMFGMLILAVNVSSPDKYIYWFPVQGFVWTFEVFRRGLPEFGWDDFYLCLAAVCWWFMLFSALLIRELICEQKPAHLFQKVDYNVVKRERRDVRSRSMKPYERE